VPTSLVEWRCAKVAAGGNAVWMTIGLGAPSALVFMPAWPDECFLACFCTGSEKPFICFACNGIDVERTTHDRTIKGKIVLIPTQTRSSTMAPGGLVS
jgi:hypothetical protein